MTTSISDVEIAGASGSPQPDTVALSRRAGRAVGGGLAQLRGELRQLSGDVAGASRRVWYLAVARLLLPADDGWWRPLPVTAAVRTWVVPVSLPPGARRHMAGWRRALLVGLAMFSVWVLLDAPTLLRSAQGSPLGARRTAAIDVLRPLSALSSATGADRLMVAVDDALGRTGRGVLQIVGPPSHVSAVHARIYGPVFVLPSIPVPTAAHPLRVLSIGDSLGVDFGGPFVNDLAATGVVNAALDAHVDTGLSRPDYFDWPTELQADLAQYRPQAVVVFLGANDPQNFVVGGQALAFGTPAWAAAYAQRVGAFMTAATASGARVLWVGMPPMADPVLGAKMQALDQIYATQAAIHPGVSYLSSWALFSNAQGAYAQYLPDATGAAVDVREPDGTHVSPGGAERLSQAVVAAMDHLWGLTLHP